MPLDMTGNHRHSQDVHYRRYLSPRTNQVAVICVQDFDYRDYDSSRFVDLVAFETEEEAELTPLSSQDVADQMGRLPEDDELGFLQGKRILHAMSRQLLYGAL